MFFILCFLWQLLSAKAKQLYLTYLYATETPIVATFKDQNLLMGSAGRGIQKAIE